MLFRSRLREGRDGGYDGTLAGTEPGVGANFGEKDVTSGLEALAAGDYDSLARRRRKLGEARGAFSLPGSTDDIRLPTRGVSIDDVPRVNLNEMRDKIWPPLERRGQGLLTGSTDDIRLPQAAQDVRRESLPAVDLDEMERRRGVRPGQGMRSYDPLYQRPVSRDDIERFDIDAADRMAGRRRFEIGRAHV